MLVPLVESCPDVPQSFGCWVEDNNVDAIIAINQCIRDPRDSRIISYRTRHVKPDSL